MNRAPREWLISTLTGVLTFVVLIALDALHVAPHSIVRAAIVGGASSFIAYRLVRR